jgi:mono/diheme cytochrome c family protein
VTAPKAPLLVVALTAVAAVATACGSRGVQVDDRGAHLFAERCSGCHTLSASGSRGSVGERISGPNLDYRKETKETVLYAIRNGGFSGAIMPQNIAVGKDAEDIAEFVAEYAGTKAKSPPAPVPRSPTAGEGTAGSPSSGGGGNGGSR